MYDNINREVIDVFSIDGLQKLARARVNHFIKLHSGPDTMGVLVDCGDCVKSMSSVMR